MKKIVMFYPYVNDDMRKEVQNTLKTRWIGQGPRVNEFEEKWNKTFKTKYAVAVSSGTASLFLAYHLMGIKPGCEIITSVLTCTATNIPLLQLGAKIVFADIKRDTLNLDPEDIKRKITKKTKCIVNVHLSGNKSDIGKMPVPIIGDSSQYHEPPMPYDRYTCYSLQAIKQITTADGGMLVVNNKSDYKRAKALRWFGINREAKRKAGWQAYKGREITTDIKEAGWKLQMTDVAASLGIGALKSYKKIMGHHYNLKKIYDKGLKNINGLTIIGGAWSYPILVEKREKFMKLLAKHGIESNIIQVRNDIVSIFGGKRLDLPNMNWVEDKYVYLPLHMRVSEKDVRFIINIIKKGW